MEHRDDPRLNMHNNIMVHVDDSTFVNGVLLNISYGGLALSSGQTDHLKMNAVVSAAFMADGRLMVLPSQVVRTSEGAAALMFVERASPRTQKVYEWLKDALRTRGTKFTVAAKSTRPRLMQAG